MVLGFLKKIFSTTADVYLPAMFFALGVFFYCDKAISYATEPNFFHVCFYITLLCAGVFLFVTKKSRQSLLFLILFFAYVSLIFLKKQENMDLTIQYHCINFFIPFSWFVYCLIKFFKLPKNFDFYFLCLLLIEGVFIENVTNFKIDKLPSYLEFSIIIFWVLCFFCYMIYVSIFPSKDNYSEFFAFLALGLGVFNKESYFALSIYFALSAIILFSGIVYSYIYAYFRDTLTGVYSNNTFMRKALNFPLKYSLGIICIDDYTKLVKVFPPLQLEKLVKMIVNRIEELSSDADIYRYHDDEFILIFKNEDKKKCFEYLENIRRAIAGAEFVLNAKRTVKITISAGVSEKKRSDADFDVVLTRTRDAVQRTYKFTQNMTTMA